MTLDSRSWARRGTAAVLCLTFLAQTSCTTLQLSSSAKPGDGQPPSQDTDGGRSGGGFGGNAVGFTLLAVAGGYMLYKLFLDDSDEEPTIREPDSAAPPAGSERSKGPVLLTAPVNRISPAKATSGGPPGGG